MVVRLVEEGNFVSFFWGGRCSEMMRNCAFFGGVCVVVDEARRVEVVVEELAGVATLWGVVVK